MKSPAFRFYPGDFWGSPDVQAMELHEVGAYVALLSNAWQAERPGCLPNDDERLRRWARMNREQWEQSRDTLLGKFPLGKDGWRVNPRLLHEAQKQVAFSASQTDKANRRWNNHKPNVTPEQSPKDAGAMPGHIPGHSEGDAGAMPSVSVSVSVSEEQKQIHTSPSAPALLGESGTKQAKGQAQQFGDSAVESIWNLWPNKGGKRQGLESIRKALAHLASIGEADPLVNLTARVRTWLAWHARQGASGEFVPAIGFAQGWFGDKQRRYLDPTAEPLAENVLLVGGKPVSQSQCEAQGWFPVRGDA